MGRLETVLYTENADVQSMSQQHVIIVGAGPGGLAASLLLAKAGVKVSVFEKSERVGGRTRTIEKEGFTFDLGPTFFHYTEVIEEIFQAIGRDAHADLDLAQLDVNYRLVFGQGGELDCTSDLDLMKDRIEALSGAKDAEAFVTYVNENRKKLERSKACLQEPWNGPGDLLSKRAMRAATVLRPTRSVADDLGRLFDDERLLLAMSFQTKYLGMSPFNCPSLFTILAFLEYEHGIFHPMGGLGSVPVRMAEIAEELGVEIHLGEAVDRVITENGRAVGIETASGEHRADAVVVNADFAKAMTEMVPNADRRRWTDKKLEKKKYSCSTFMLYLGVDRTYDHLPHHQIYASSTYVENLKDIEDRHVVTWDDPSVYVQNACVTDPQLAPEGCSTVYVLVPVTQIHPNVNWSDISADYRERILDQIETKLGYENIRDHIVTEMMMTPDDWGDYCYRGAVFNLAHGLDQMLWRRPRNRFEDVDSMYLVGGGTHPGSGLPVIFESARISSKLVLDDLGIVPDWNGVSVWFDSVRRSKNGRRALKSIGAPRPHKGGEPTA